MPAANAACDVVIVASDGARASGTLIADASASDCSYADCGSGPIPYDGALFTAEEAGTTGFSSRTITCLPGSAIR